jgi:hypothetical protein
MKLGIANRITVEDVDLAATVDITLKYSDVVFFLQHGNDELADLFLNILEH